MTRAPQQPARCWTNGEERYTYAGMADAELIADMLLDPEVGRWLWFTPAPRDSYVEFFRPFVDGQQALLDAGDVPRTAVFAVTSETGEFLGQGAVIEVEGSPDGYEIGYQLRREAWGRGVATRLARFLAAYAVDLLGAYRIEATILAGNIGSKRVAEKLGLEVEGRRAGFRLKEQTRHDELLYGALVETLDPSLGNLDAHVRVAQQAPSSEGQGE